MTFVPVVPNLVNSFCVKLCMNVTNKAGMAAIIKPTQIRIRISDEDAETLEKLTGGVLTTAIAASALLHGAAEAVRKNKGKVHFPPVFEVLKD